jgi:hypothetical protein
MSRKKKAGLPYNNLVVVTNAKEHFLALCKMYDKLGQFLNLHTKTLGHPLFAKTSIHQTQSRILEQYREIGEEMKTIGTHLDLMGGKPVMKAEEPEKKEEKKDQDKVFVNNTKPPEKKKDKKDKEDKEEKK